MRKMSQPAKAQEPSMEEILASIRRIIADDDAAKPAAKAPETPAPPKAAAPSPTPRPAPAEPEAPMNQADIDAMLGGDVAEEKPAPADAPPPADILELTESMATEPPAEPAPEFRKIDASPDVVFSEEEDAQESKPAAAFDFGPSPASDQAQERALLSAATTHAVDSAFNTLAHTVLVQNARTLEDLVREMLRPMLKSWLDDNLPGLVERLVRAEIERVSRGRT
jgi:cell pole-organizing protein PopZ